METQISFSTLRSNSAVLLLAVGLAVIGGKSYSQTVSSGEGHSSLKITEWQDSVSASVRLLHQLFPDINPMSKVIVENKRDWKASPTGIGAFMVYVCDPDFPSRGTELRHDFFTRYDVQCSVLTIRASFLMSGSPLGAVPAEMK